MTVSLLVALALAQAPVHLGVSVGTGIDHALLGAQVEAGLGPVSVAAAIAPGGSVETAPRAAAVRIHLPRGVYLFGSASTRTYAPVPLNYQVENPYADRWHNFSAGLGMRLNLGAGFFADSTIGFPVTCGRYWPWPDRANWSWWCNQGTPWPGDYVPAIPDFGVSLGYALNGDRLAVEASTVPPIVAAGWAGLAVDGLALGAITASANYQHGNDPTGFDTNVGSLALLGALILARPFVVAWATCWSRRDLSVGAYLRSLAPALAADLVGFGALIVSAGFTDTRAFPLFTGMVAARSVLTPWAATVWTAPSPADP